MVDIKLKMNGRTIKPEEIENEINREILKKIIATIRDKVENIRCPIHGEKPKIICVAKSLEDIDLKVEGCCDTLISEVKKAFE